MQAVFSMAVLSALLAFVSCTLAASDYSPEDIIALERGALDRWGKGDLRLSSCRPGQSLCYS